MILTEQEIIDRVTFSQNSRQGFESKAALWESMWRLRLWDKSNYEAHTEGKEQVTLPDPLNIVHLAEQLVNRDPSIQVPPTRGDVEDQDKAEKSRTARMRFLNAAWTQNSRQQRKNIIGHAWWMSLVRSRFAFQVKWVDDLIPSGMKGEILPFHISVLDPLKCGFHHGELWTEWAYHQYDEDVIRLKQLYPHVDFEDDNSDRPPGERYRQHTETDTSQRTVTEFWYISEGKVYMAVLVNEALAQGPDEMPRYGRIPIIEVLGDDYPMRDEEDRAHSILRPIEDIWQAQSRLVSQVATGQLWHFWPQVIVEGDEPMDTTGIGPGMDPLQVPMGTKLSLLAPQANLPISDRLMTTYDEQMQRSSFPPSMYGIPSAAQAGYSAQIHQAAARGRVVKPLTNLEMGMAIVNRLLLQFVEKQSSGIEIWGEKPFQDSEGNQFYSIKLMPEDVAGNYGSTVNLEPEVPQEDTAGDTLAIRAHDSGIASKSTTRDQMSWKFPDDEDERILREQQIAAEAAAEQRAYAIMVEAEAQRRVQQMMQPAPVPGPGGVPPSGSGPQPVQSPAMMNGVASQQLEGQLTPEMMGLDPATAMDLMNTPSTADQLRNLDPNVAGNGREV